MLVRRLWHTFASGRNQACAPAAMTRMLKSISSPMRMSLKPPTCSKSGREMPRLKLRGENLPMLRLFPRIPPVVKTEVME